MTTTNNDGEWIDDRELIDLMLQRESRDLSDAASCRFYDRYMLKLRSLVRQNLSQRLKSRIDADDITQEVFFDIFQMMERGNVESMRTGEAWKLMCAIALNKIREKSRFHLAKMRTVQRETDKTQDLVDTVPDPSQEDAVAILDVVATAARRLDEPSRVVMQGLLDGKHIDEMAKELGRTTKSVSRLQRRVIEVFQDLLTDSESQSHLMQEIDHDGQSGKSSLDYFTQMSEAAVRLECRARSMIDLGDPKTAIDPLAECRRLYKSLADDAPNSSRWRRDLARVCRVLCDVHITIGDTGSAQLAVLESLEISRALSDAFPKAHELKREFASDLGTLGRIRIAQGDLSDAASLTEESLNILHSLLSDETDNVDWTRDVSNCTYQLGLVLISQGELDNARIMFDKAAAISERLLRRDPDNVQWGQDLARAINQLGLIFESQDRFDLATAEFRRSLSIIERLTRRNPSNVRWQRELAIRHDQLGRVYLRMGNFVQAILAFQEGLKFAERLVELNPEIAHFQRDLSISCFNIGSVSLQNVELPHAEEMFARALEIQRRLVGIDPANVQWQHDMSVFHKALASVNIKNNYAQKAIEHLFAALNIENELIQLDLSNVEFVANFAMTLAHTGQLLLLGSDSAKAQGRKLLAQSLKYAEAIEKSGLQTNVARTTLAADLREALHQIDAGGNNE